MWSRPSLCQCRVSGATPQNVAWMGQIEHPSLFGSLTIQCQIAHGPSSVGSHSWLEGILRQDRYRRLDLVVVAFLDKLGSESYAPAPTEYENARYRDSGERGEVM